MNIIDETKLQNSKAKIREIAREKARDKSRLYYENNKDIIKAKLCVKIQCELCGRVVIYNNLKQHQTKNICKKLQQTI
jgi:hypothetical protein